MDDITVIFITLNALPVGWTEFHRGHLLRAVEGMPLVVISKDQMDWNRPQTEYLIQSEPPSAWNVYRQLLRGALLADTPYVAVAEDDTLYPRRHFTDFRPKDNEISYDMSRWSVFSWQPNPFFSAIRRHGNFTMIGPRRLVIDAIMEREETYPDGLPEGYAGEIGRPDVERRLKVKRNKLVEWYCTSSMVNLCHTRGLSPTYINTPGLSRKPGELKAYSVPEWGHAADIAKIYNEGNTNGIQADT